MKPTLPALTFLTLLTSTTAMRTTISESATKDYHDMDLKSLPGFACIAVHSETKPQVSGRRARTREEESEHIVYIRGSKRGGKVRELERIALKIGFDTCWQRKGFKVKKEGEGVWRVCFPKCVGWVPDP